MNLRGGGRGEGTRVISNRMMVSPSGGPVIVSSNAGGGQQQMGVNLTPLPSLGTGTIPQMTNVGGGFWRDPLSYAFTPGVSGPQPGVETEPDPAVIILARGVRVQSKFISWSFYSWPWIVFVLAFIVGNGALMVFAGLDAVGIGLASPLLLIIWHFVLFVIFGILLIWTLVRFATENLLEDKLRLPFLVSNATLYNFVMTIAFLAWILNNTSLHAKVHFTSNSQAYVSYIVLNGITFIWFYVLVCFALISWLVHYNYRKFLELTDLALSVQDEHLIMLHGTNLQSLVQSLRSQQQQQSPLQMLTLSPLPLGVEQAGFQGSIGGGGGGGALS